MGTRAWMGGSTCKNIYRYTQSIRRNTRKVNPRRRPSCGFQTPLYGVFQGLVLSQTHPTNFVSGSTGRRSGCLHILRYLDPDQLSPWLTFEHRTQTLRKGIWQFDCAFSFIRHSPSQLLGSTIFLFTVSNTLDPCKRGGNVRLLE